MTYTRKQIIGDYARTIVYAILSTLVFAIATYSYIALIMFCKWDVNVFLTFMIDTFV